jgi:hypothetical protein
MNAEASPARQLRDSRAGLRIKDLARPVLPLPLRLANGIGGPFGSTLIRFDEDSLLGAARRRTGLTDFGDAAFREPLRVFLRALEEEAGLNAFGRFSARELVLGLLGTRLRLARLLDAHPEILDEPLESPIVIMGLPRTGTTHLHSLISADPSLRSLPYWESLEPIPAEIPVDRPSRTPASADPRFQRCDRAMKMLHWAMPLFPRMHEMSALARHEEVQLLAVDFSTMLLEASNRIPSYRDWYVKHDQTGAYRTLRRLLQALQWMDGRPRRWVLKSPQHLEQIGPLLEVFPDAKVIQTHRDPVRVTASFATMAAYSLRMGTSRVDVAAVGAYWSDRIERMLRASVEDRPLLPATQIHDLRFHDFMGRELESVEQIYDFAGQPFDARVRDALTAYQRANPRGRHGTIDYRLEDFGLDVTERQRALAFYAERFGLSTE